MDQRKTTGSNGSGADTARIIVLGLAVLLVAAGVISVIAAG